MSKIRLFSEWVILLIIAFVFVILANSRGWAERIDLNLLDFANSLSSSEGRDDIIIVTIDDQSLAKVGNWPWDRTRHAELVDQLAKLEPSVIALDVLFLEQSNAEADARLAQSIADAGNVVLPYTFFTAQDGSEDRLAAMPIPQLAGAAAGLGHVSIDADQDGVVRRFAPQYRGETGSRDHFTRIVAQLAGFEDTTETSSEALPIIQYQLPGGYRTETAANVIDGAARPEFFKDKIVLIGATAQGLGDRHAVPTYAGRIMPGVEVQANALDAMMSGTSVAGLEKWIVIALHLAAVLSLFLVYWLRPPAEALRYSILLITALVVFAFASVILFKTWLPVAPALAAILIAYPLWGWRRLATVSRFLDREVDAMRATGFEMDDANSPEKQENASWLPAFGSTFSGGFDVVQRQVASLRGLTGEVRERLSFIQDVVDASPDPMMVFDGEGRLALFNAAAQGIFLGEKQDSELTLNELVANLGGQIDANSYEVSLPSQQTFLVASAPLDKGLGSEIVALRDITAIKQGEKQRQETLEFLSHDMRSPQVAIIGLTGKSGKGLELEDRFGRIAEQARRTLQLAENFVQIARLENEGIRAEDTEMGALVYEAADRAYAIAKRKSITIDCQVPEDPIFCEADPSAISRVVDNLLSNALKFSPQASQIRLSLSEAANDRLSLVVEDEGPGMPAERQSQPFARFGANDSKAGPSAGLGLAFVKRAVDEHGGEIAVRSAANKGTRIEIDLPVSQQAAN